MSRVPRRIQDLVYERDGYRCVACGSTNGLSIQHRANAGMGGSKTAHTPANLIVMCLIENQALESNAIFARQGRAHGWKISKSADPTVCPVLYAGEGLFLLDNDGNRTPYVDDVPF